MDTQIKLVTSASSNTNQ